jgi:alkylation response protein AidB-like acyl-CoA dehydrogenase
LKEIKGITMDFNFSEQQNMLRNEARRFLTKECPKTKVKELEKDERGYAPQMWRDMADMGWMGLVLPEEYGGLNADFIDLMVLMEEMGRNILPGPFFSTVALCALPLLEYGKDVQKLEYLPQIAKGEKIWTLAMTESSGDYRASAIKAEAKSEGGEFVINGEKMFVPYANVADYLLVIARTAKGKVPEKGLTFFIVNARNPGINIEIIPTLTGEKQCKVSFKNVKIPKEDILGKMGQGWDIVEYIMRKATILKCAEISGACQAVLDMSNTYAKERMQFGKPIGSFQVIQHKLVDMLIDVEGLQYLVYQAAWLIGTAAPCDLQIAAAKARANEVYRSVALSGIKIHGAIGFTMDHDIGLYYRRVLEAESFLGDTDLHLEKVAVNIGL